MKRTILLTAALSSLLLVAMSLFACGDGGSGDEDSVTRSVGPEGAILTIRGGTLSIPKGALREKTELTFAVSELGAGQVDHRVRVTKSFRIEPSTVRFISFATLTVDYLPALLPSDVLASAFDFRRMDDAGSQERLNGVTVDVDASTISGEVLRPGVFWATVPEASRPAAIAFSQSEATLSVGESIDLAPVVTDQSGALIPMESSGLFLSVEDASVASVDGSGVVTAQSPGRTVVTARAGAAFATFSLAVRDDGPFAGDFSWRNPLPQGNSITAVARDESGRILFATTQGAIWRQGSGDEFHIIHQLNGVRFAGIAALDGAIVAAGASGQSGILLTLAFDDPASDQTASAASIAVPASPFTRLAFDGEAGVATGGGTSLLVYDKASNAWAAVDAPSFDTTLAAGRFDGRLVVLTAAGSLFEFRGDGWSKLGAAVVSNSLSDGVATAHGFAAIDADGRLYAIGANGGEWSVQCVACQEEAPSAEADGGDADAGEDAGLGDGEGPEDAPDAGEDAGLPQGDSDGGDDDVAADPSGDDDDGRLFLLGLYVAEDGSLIIRGRDDSGQLALIRNPEAAEGGEGNDLDSSTSFTALRIPDDEATVLWGATPTDILAGGASGVLHAFDGEGWSAISSGSRDWIIALKSFDDGQVFALTEHCLNETCTLATNGVLAKGADEDAFRDITPEYGFAKRLHALSGLTSNEVWVAGESGAAYRYAGGHWEQAPFPAMGAIYALENCRGRLVAAGDSGSLAYVQDGAWSTLVQNGGGALRSVSCTEDELFAVGDYSILYRKGSDAFAVLSPNDNAIRTAYWRTVYAAPTGEAFIGGDARYVLFWNGNSFDFFDYPARLSVYAIKAVSGSGAADVWAAGVLTSGEGFLVHYDGADWSRVTIPSVHPILALEQGGGGSSLWVGGGNGTILQGTRPVPEG